MTDALLWRRIENMRWLLPRTETRRLVHPTLQLFAKMECVNPSGIPVLDPNVNSSTERALRQACDRVEKVDRDDGAGGSVISGGAASCQPT